MFVDVDIIDIGSSVNIGVSNNTFLGVGNAVS
jgi:hypothetical protein